MLNSTSKGDFWFSLLIAAVFHVVLFFAAAAAVALELVQGKVAPKEPVEKKVEPIPVQLVYEEEELEVPAMVAEPVETTPVVEPEPKPEPAEPDTAPSFVQTREDQEVEERPEDADLIGERNTEATSDEGAEAGDEKMAALAGDEERKYDPKTFDSDFTKGEQSGPTVSGEQSVETGQGMDEVNQERVESPTTDPGETEQASLPVEEKVPAPTPEKLPTIDSALAALEEELRDQAETKPVEPTAETKKGNLVPKPKSEEREASNDDGGFAPRSRKTRVAGVLSASGNGSLEVANTAVGRYQATIFKKLETAWQIKNISNRSVLVPGNITLYFVVDKSGEVSRQSQVSRVGASGLQWGLILRSLDDIQIPRMPDDVVKELEGDPLEIIVTFNY